MEKAACVFSGLTMPPTNNIAWGWQYGTKAACVFSGLTMPPTNNIAWGWQYGTKAACVFSGLTMPPSTTRQLLGEGTINDLLGAGNDQLSAWGWQYGKSCLRVQRADHATNQQHRMGLALYGTEAATYVFSGLTMPPTNSIAWLAR
ncbi:hypothetical protein N7516_008724 [Penicillium verrucosum]|uniref:uncharacterized protein n=1 Tax=Penicillium verrucosum TaxID=60171 RepID=UPI002545AA53|nr:uncharacterized protein N7516_008724 [Penicillium verrucosum]KAJ5926951.1 hypothetical protein N7516_008724 [Penicillium verrucosum]